MLQILHFHGQKLIFVHLGKNKNAPLL